MVKNCRNQSFSIDITHPLILNSFPGFIHYSFYIFNRHYLRQKVQFTSFNQKKNWNDILLANLNMLILVNNLVIEFKTADIALLMFRLVHSTPVISSCSKSPHLESLNQCKGQRKEYFLILHSYLMHFLQSFISLLQSISYLKLNLSKLNILYLLYNDHSLSLTWIFYFMMSQIPRGRKVFL